MFSNRSDEMRNFSAAAAARKASPGDILIIASYAAYTELELEKFKPQLVYVDANNRITAQRREIPVQAA